MTFGGDWRQVRGEYVYRDEAEFDLLFDSEGTPQQPQRSRDLSAYPTGDLYGVYSSLRLAPRAEWILDLGLRWDRSTLPESHDAELSPRINLLYEPVERTRLRAGWGEYAQMQGVDELQIADGVSEFLPAQRSEQWVLSAERVLVDNTLLRLELYHKRYSLLHARFENFLNTTAILPELKPDRMRIAPTSALAEGIELSARRTDRGPLFWWASYAWTRVKDRFSDGQALRSWDQEHAISTGIGWRQELWQMSMAANYHTGWPSSTAELLTEDPIPIASVQRNTTRLKDYFDIDLRVARDFHSGGGDSLSVFFELSNVLNRGNECCIEYEFEDEDGEQFLELERVKSLGILPSIGFTYRF